MQGLAFQVANRLQSGVMGDFRFANFVRSCGLESSGGIDLNTHSSRWWVRAIAILPFSVSYRS